MHIHTSIFKNFSHKNTQTMKKYASTYSLFYVYSFIHEKSSHQLYVSIYHNFIIDFQHKITHFITYIVYPPEFAVVFLQHFDILNKQCHNIIEMLKTFVS